MLYRHSRGRLAAPLLTLVTALTASVMLTACDPLGSGDAAAGGGPAADSAPAQDGAPAGGDTAGESASGGDDAVPADGPVTSAVAGAKDGDACAILSREQAAEALGKSVLAGRPKLSDTGPTCIYQHRKGQPVDSITVGISNLVSTPAEMKELLDEVTKTAFTLEPINGLGDEAYYVLGGNIAYVALDGKVYTIIAYALDPKPPAVDAAKLLVDNLT